LRIRILKRKRDRINPPVENRATTEITSVTVSAKRVLPGECREQRLRYLIEAQSSATRRTAYPALYEAGNEIANRSRNPDKRTCRPRNAKHRRAGRGSHHRDDYAAYCLRRPKEGSTVNKGLPGIKGAGEESPQQLLCHDWRAVGDCQQQNEFKD